MKKRNYVAAILLASLMATSTAIAMPVTAADGDVTVTFAKDTIARDYEIYQIFTGTVTGTGDKAVLTALSYGSGIDEDKIPTATYADVDAFADAIAAMSGTEAADFLNDYLSTTKTAVTSSTSDNVPKDLAPGYYLIKDVTTADTAANDAISQYILEVVDPVTISPKRDFPTLDKKIGDAYATGTKTSVASVGDKVPYVLESNVPDMTGYNTYYYVINDTMDSGLTFDPTSVSVVINGKDDEGAAVTKTLKYKAAAEAADSTEWFDVQTGEAAGDYTFQIVFHDFLQYANIEDAVMTVKYEATLNEGAVLYTASNNNTVNLTYSNNPNYDYASNTNPGTPDEPKSTNPTGVTPDSQTKTYTTGISIIKVDGKTKNFLPGVKFRLSGTGVKTTYVNGEYFTIDDNGTYWKLTNGSFTTVDPEGEGVDTSDYVSTTTKYKKVTDTSELATLTNVEIEGVTGGDGVLTFRGLVPGDYTITEVEPLPNYNPIDPIDITITAATSEGEYINSGWTAVDGDNNDLDFDKNSTNCFEIEIANNQGVTLPETGGIGTVLFYVVGGTLVAGSLVLLITKKRMGEKE